MVRRNKHFHGAKSFREPKMNIWDKFGALSLASAFRCAECKDLKDLIRLGYRYKLNESNTEKLIKSLEKHIKDKHPERYEYLIRRTYPDWDFYH